MELAISQSLVKKLHPSRFTAMSSQMAAMVAHVLSVQWTDPQINEFVITSDGFIIIDGDFYGAFSDWKANCERLFQAAGLTQRERDYFIWLHNMRVIRHAPQGMMVVAGGA
jgi:hypothetical protein